MPKRKFCSYDSDDEKKEKRRKQKRDYATRRREREKNLMKSLDSANRRLFRRSKRQKQQIEELRTWALYAKSYLNLCHQFYVFSPEALADPLGKPRRQSAIVTSLPGTTPSKSQHEATSNKSRAVALKSCAGQVSREAGLNAKGRFCTFGTSSNITFEPATTSGSSTSAVTVNMSTIFSNADMISTARDRFTDLNKNKQVRFSTADTTLESKLRESGLLSSDGNVLHFLSKEATFTHAAFDKDLDFPCDQFSARGELCAAR